MQQAVRWITSLVQAFCQLRKKLLLLKFTKEVLQVMCRLEDSEIPKYFASCVLGHLGLKLRFPTTSSRMRTNLWLEGRQSTEINGQAAYEHDPSPAPTFTTHPGAEPTDLKLTSTIVQGVHRVCFAQISYVLICTTHNSLCT